MKSSSSGQQPPLSQLDSMAKDWQICTDLSDSAYRGCFRFLKGAFTLFGNNKPAKVSEAHYFTGFPRR